MINSFFVLPLILLSILFAYAEDIKDIASLKLTGQNSITRFEDNVLNGKFIEYQSPALGISFSYPESWKIIDEPNPAPYIVTSTHSLSVGSGVYWVEFFKDPAQESIDELVGDKELTGKKENINGIEFIAVSYTYSTFTTPKYLISKNPNMMIITKTSTDSRYRKSYDKVLDKIIRSIKVL